MMQMNIQSRQLAAVEKMLKLEQIGTTTPGYGAPNKGAAAVSQQWKVLIYDSFCRDIIGPLITVPRLRENGVTLHMLIESPRESIPDVPAVYFFRPTPENIALFVQDCQKQLYDTAYLNFCSPIPRELMETLARRLVEINCVNVVARVYDQYLGFVSLEQKLFSLNIKNSFSRYSKRSLEDTAIERCMEEISMGACAMVATLGIAPIIRCPPGGPAEMVARRVTEMVRVLIEQQSSFFAQGMGRGVLEQRPMMLIVDRSIDLCAPLMHTSGYQTLVDDLLEVSLDRVKVPPPLTRNSEGVLVPSSEPSKTFTLDKESDSFWATYAGSLIAAAVEGHAKELRDVEMKEEQIKQQTGKDVSSLGSDGNGETSALLSTVQSLPALLEKKKHLERHLAILKAVMDVISRRQIHLYVEPEDNMMFSKYVEKKDVLALASNPAMALQDKVRLFSIYLLSTSPSPQDSEEVENAIVASSAAEPIDSEAREQLLKALRYIKTILSMSMERLSKMGENNAQRPSSAGGLWDIASITRSALQNASRQVKSMVGGSKIVPSVRMMHLACRESTSESQASEQDSQLLYLDPKVRGEVPPSSRLRSAFNRGILFVVGGGCMGEYQNLQDYASGKISVSGGASAALRLGASDGSGASGIGKDNQFMYGCSELINATKFLEQLAQCANS